MVKGQEGEDHIRNWMRNRNTLEFLGAWEMLHNPAFKGVEFDTFLHEAGTNRFNMTPRKWIEATCTAKQWREANPEYAKKGLNIRDIASINELVVLANLESFNAELLKRDIDKFTRYACLHEMAERQLTRLDTLGAEKGFRKLEAKKNSVKSLFFKWLSRTKSEIIDFHAMKPLNLLLICFFLCRTFLLQAQEREEPSELHHLAFDTPVNNGHWKIYSSDYHVQQDTVIKTAGKSSWKITSLSEEMFLMTFAIRTEA